jgi:vancomycin resistance protein VanW
MKIRFLFILIISLLLPFGLVKSSRAGDTYDRLWGGFSTSLAGRSAEQLHNAARAVLDLNGAIISPGGIFSFNELTGGRDASKGYTRAPMINDHGSLQDVPGGGICQLATTIYNAALYAGLDIVERHPHSRLVTYVPPGRDATIVTWRKDLKLHNPFRAPLMLRIALGGKRLTASIWSVEEKHFEVRLHTDSVPLEPATAVVKSVKQTGFRKQPGGKGFSVITRRSILKGGVVMDQVISEDYYPPPSRIITGDGL